MNPRKFAAELIGTTLLVIVGVGVATVSFGFKATGTSTSAGVVATALAFGLVLLALAYTLGPISGCHVNPAVTLGFLVSGRIDLDEAISYWVAQFVGGILGAVILWAIVSGAPGWSAHAVGLGADGYGAHSMVGIKAGGAFATEVVLTFIFVLVVLGATSRIGSPTAAGLAIGVGLVCVHLVGIPLDGVSVNPARALGPAIIVGSSALKQVWVFIVAPLVGAILAAVAFRLIWPAEKALAEGDASVALGD